MLESTEESRRGGPLGLPNPFRGPLASSALPSRWAWVVLRGVAGIVLGLFAFARPAITGLTLVLLFAAYAFVDGVANVISAARGGRAGEPRWGMLLLEGLLSIAVAVVAVLWPATTALAFLWVIGFWA